MPEVKGLVQGIPCRGRRCRRPHLANMATEPLRFQLELAHESDPIEGLLRREQGENVPFTGWLELITAIEATRTHAPEATRRDSRAGRRKEQHRMSTEENKTNVARWREEIWNNRNVSVIDELAAPDYVGHLAGTPEPVRGPEALKRLFAAYLGAFETHVTPEFLVAEGDLVAVHDTNWLKHTGEFQGAPATGKDLTWSSTDIYRFVHGRVVEQWFEADLTGMMQQLGLLPTSGVAGIAAAIESEGQHASVR